MTSTESQQCCYCRLTAVTVVEFPGETTHSTDSPDTAGTGSSRPPSAGSSRGTRRPAARRSRRGRRARPRRRCSSSWRASGGRRPTGASPGTLRARPWKVGAQSLLLHQRLLHCWGAVAHPSRFHTVRYTTLELRRKSIATSGRWSECFRAYVLGMALKHALSP